MKDGYVVFKKNELIHLLTECNGNIKEANLKEYDEILERDLSYIFNDYVEWNFSKFFGSRRLYKFFVQGLGIIDKVAHKTYLQLRKRNYGKDDFEKFKTDYLNGEIHLYTKKSLFYKRSRVVEAFKDNLFTRFRELNKLKKIVYNCENNDILLSHEQWQFIIDWSIKEN